MICSHILPDIIRRAEPGDHPPGRAAADQAKTPDRRIRRMQTGCASFVCFWMRFQGNPPGIHLFGLSEVQMVVDV